MGEIAPEEQFLPLSTIFYDLMLDFYVKTGIRFSFRDKRLFEITEVEITRVDCICVAIRGYLDMSVFEITKVNCNMLSILKVYGQMVQMGPMSTAVQNQMTEH